MDLFALNWSRYALSKGASALAVDIGEAAHSDGNESTIKVSQYNVQRRSEDRLQAEDPVGSL